MRGHRYTKRLILKPISAARPRIDFCTKNPPRIFAFTSSPRNLSNTDFHGKHGLLYDLDSVA